jgi:hypothetical protein
MFHHLPKGLSHESGRGLELRGRDSSLFRLDDLHCAAAASVNRPRRVALANELPGGIISAEPMPMLLAAAPRGELRHFGRELLDLFWV